MSDSDEPTYVAPRLDDTSPKPEALIKRAREYIAIPEVCDLLSDLADALEVALSERKALERRVVHLTGALNGRW